MCAHFQVLTLALFTGVTCVSVTPGALDGQTFFDATEATLGCVPKN